MIIITEQSKIECESAGIGRQARLRGVWQQSCEFKSHPAYIQIVHIVSFKSWLYGFFLFKQPIGLHYSVIGEGGSQIMMKKPHPHSHVDEVIPNQFI